MSCINIVSKDATSVITMSRGKVNAINPDFVAELSGHLAELADNPEVKTVVLTGNGKFFSFGFDIPEMYDYSKEEFTRFLVSFCNLYRDLFLFPKPVIAAINGHAVAGGCILALACDYRMMIDDSAKMALNEVTFGASIFAGTVAMLKHCVGNRAAEKVLLTGHMFSPKEALELGLADELVKADNLMESTTLKAEEYGRRYSPAFTSLKRLLRQPVVDEWSDREEESIREFVEIWYSPETRAQTKKIVIRS
ncbi:MAG: enoyl-CoA hydratase/isomerase family protein [candidate division Zixibacteria bacterium HGW-Zixibacteria-1]|nr:MAG: enoyl-CoA hydratase/isomerase family protein [candidate division Zixibacteria bacterium HGW-Zixibacteria-1]